MLHNRIIRGEKNTFEILGKKKKLTYVTTFNELACEVFTHAHQGLKS